MLGQQSQGEEHMTKDEALKLALEALEEAWYHVGTFQPTEKAIDLYDEARTAIKEALAQMQEPVAWITPDGGEGFRIRFSPPVNDVPLGWDALYTTPPLRKPLTDEQIEKIAEGYLVDYRIPAGCAWNFARDIEAAHGIKEKNT